jgi:hypothetical protein
MRQKKPKKDRNKVALREAKLDEDRKKPLNRLLNSVDDEGKPKYEIANRIRTWFLANPDPALNSMRLINSLLHELRWHKNMARKYFDNHISADPVEMRDKEGKVMTKDECYIAHIQEKQVNHIVMAKLRDQLIQGLAPCVDEEVFTLDQYHEYMLEVEDKVKELGFELFPDKVEVIHPL